jgi:hypothetical protein
MEIKTVLGVNNETAATTGVLETSVKAQTKRLPTALLEALAPLPIRIEGRRYSDDSCQWDSGILRGEKTELSDEHRKTAF